MKHEVTCITVDSGSRYDDCRCIQKIGYQTSNGEARESPAEIHEYIKSGDKFYIVQNGSRTYLEPVERDGTKYVRTKPNDTKKDNLLKQPGCKY